jgi:2,4-dienoyl-CoA reductase-like NADH-dependent reductase (Old Yellow Enzyme family)/thioredoxin reductase
VVADSRNRQIRIHYASAQGGTSLIVTESFGVDIRHTQEQPKSRIDGTKYEAGIHRLVDAIHLNDVPIVIQIHQAGMFGTDPISPSGVPAYGFGRAKYVQPRVISLAEAEEARDRFIEAAVRAKNAEADGVVVHAATSYILEQFISPHTNKRTDRYGESFENRITLPLEIARGIRQRCGPSFVLGFSIVADELLPDGITLKESIPFSKALKEAGVDFVDLMLGCYETNGFHPRGALCYRQEKGLFDISEAFKKEVNMPIFARSWGEYDVTRWEEALEKRQCDVILIGRPLLCDPELPKKVAEGRLDDVRFCIRCNYCFDCGVSKNWQVACALNSELGNERDYALQPAPKQKKVLVVGGGPGGLEAARVAALRGQDVTLMEREAKLGGNLRIASLSPGKADYQTNFADWAERQFKKVGVKVELNKEVTVDVVNKLKPDVVIVATGATPLIPPIPGINKSHVVLAADVLTGKVSVGKKVVVVGGGDVGIGVADFVTAKGLAKDVTIVIRRPDLAAEMYAINSSYMLGTVLPRSGVKMVTNMYTEEITDDGIIATDRERNKHKFEADTVIIARGYTPSTTLFEALEGNVSQLYRIGDCRKPRHIAAAVHEGAYIARQI